MKTILGLLLLILTSCGSSSSRTKPTSNTDYENIIGTPIKFGNLEVAQYDFPEEMKWDEAKKVCEILGDGWRLPTADELNTLYQNKVTIGGFRDNLYPYWSSTEFDTSNAFYQYFLNGNQDYWNKNYSVFVRVIRTL
jgi:hypothetical protein